MRIQQKVTLYEKICKWKTGSICHAKGSKVLYLSGDPNAGPLKGWFLLACWIFCNVTKLFKQWLVNMLIILLLTFWYATIQYRKRWIPLCICSVKPVIFEYCYDTLGYKTRTFMWIIEKWKMENSCLISNQIAAILPTKSYMQRLTLNELSNASGLMVTNSLSKFEAICLAQYKSVFLVF